MKAESEKKKSRNPGSGNKKSIENIPEINKIFFENSLDAMMIGFQDGGILKANPAACRMLGFSEKEIRELGRKGIVEQTPQLAEAIRRRKESGNFLGELTYFRKDGTKFPAEVSSTEFKLTDGKVLTTLIMRDITDRKKTETSLVESEERLRLASQATGFGSYSYDFVTHETYFSDEFLAIYGILSGNTIEHNIDLLSRSFHPEDKEYFLNASYKANDPEGSGVLDVEFRIIKQDGEIRLLKARGRTIFSGNSKKDKPLHANGLIQDITEDKVIENAFKQAHDWQKSIFEGSMDAIFISDENSVLIAVNKAACDLTGYSREELLKMRIPDLHDELDLEAFKKYHKKIFKGEKILSEAKIRRRDGVKVDTEFNNSRISILGKFYMHTTARDITERKKSERELFEFGERYRLLMENSGLAIGYYSLDGKILMLNQQAFINLGGKPGDYIGKNVTEVFGKEAGLIYIDRYKRVAASEKPLKFEDNVILDGNPGWYMSTYTRILDKNGNVEGIQVIADNITQKKIAENTILEKNANLTAIFENTKDMIASRDKKNCLVAFNTSFNEIVRKLYNAEAVPGLNTLKYLKKKDEIKWNGILNDVLNGMVYKSEFDWDFGNGDIRTYTISYQPIIKNGEIIGTLETNRDITESKRADDKIREGYLYARSLIEASLDPLVTINIDGKITDVNVATEKITGIQREKLIGRDFADYFSRPERARKGYKTVFSNGVVKDYPLTILHTSGRKIDVLYNASLFRNESGEVQGVFAAARDVTEQKKMEEEILKSKEFLEKLNQHLVEVRENERNEIALNLHDDLGQKLTAINLDIAWLKSRIGVQSKPVREKIEEMSSMIKETIESIKETSALLRPAILFDLGLVPAIKWQLGIFEKQTGIKCNFYFRPEEFILEDRLSLILYRIFQESLTNIARHSGASKADIHLNVLKNKIELIIKDDGSGIEKNKVNSFKSLGIAGIIERVKSVNGRMNIVGEPGSGTMISVEIPLLKVKSND